MEEACLFDIMGMPDASLKRVLPKVATRTVTRLLSFYPRAIGLTLLNILSESMSPSTIAFLKEEMHTGQIPSYAQVRDAEKELIKLLHEEKLLPPNPPTPHI